MQFPQLLSIVRYEFKMQWRARGILVIMLAILSLNVIITLLTASSMEEYPQLASVPVSRFLASIWAPMAVTLIFVLPIIAADIIPKDRQLGTGEIIESTPLQPGTYLAGKVLSVWAAMFAGLLIIMIVTSVIWMLVLGIFDWPGYLEMWLIGVVSLVILNGSLGVLIAATQPSRRRAIIVAIGVFFIVPFILNITDTQTLMAYLNPVRYPILGYYLFSTTALQNFTFDNMVKAIAIGLAEVAVIWAMVWGWLRWRESRP
ncbi:MAG: ABC transporter permease [Anaerolineae bacterium]|nr:ABC transporter permease [Anaerolineae bacterium]